MKVLLILVDGMRADAAAGSESPLLRELTDRGCYSLSARTVMPSVTLPCHMSLFHSVQPERHGILTNTYVPQVRPVEGICELLRKNEKTSSMFYTWEELKDLTRPDSMSRTSFASAHLLGGVRAGEIILEDACREMRENRPDFCFLYLGYPDDVGHDHGWMSREYLASVERSLGWAAQAMEAAGPEYLTILTADHGGHDRAEQDPLQSGVGRTHGEDIPADMTIPFFMSHSSLPGRALAGVSILDIAPTIAAALGVKPPREWEGRNLLAGLL